MSTNPDLTASLEVAEAASRAVGRPRKQFDLDQVRSLARLGCTLAELAGFFGCAESTMSDRSRNDPEFSKAIKEGVADLKTSLRAAQVRKALDGNVGMLVWLGKQYLGQSDQHTVEHGEKPRKGIILPSRLTEEDYATMVDLMRKSGTLPGEHGDTDG